MPTLGQSVEVQQAEGGRVSRVFFAAMIVRISNRFKAEVIVEKDSEQVNGKSIMGLMMLAAGQGSRLTFRVSGEGGEELLLELGRLFDRRFEES